MNAQTTTDPVTTIRRCRVCRCTDDRACVDAFGLVCYWVGPNLCSFCQTIEIPIAQGGQPAGHLDRRPELTKASKNKIINSTTGEPSPAPPRSAVSTSPDRCYAGKDAKVPKTPETRAGKTAAGARRGYQTRPPPVFDHRFTELMYAAVLWREDGRSHSQLMRVDNFDAAEKLATRILEPKLRRGREITHIEIKRVL